MRAAGWQDGEELQYRELVELGREKLSDPMEMIENLDQYDKVAYAIVIAFTASQVVVNTAPYGRYTGKTATQLDWLWSRCPPVNARLAWVLFELPSLLSVAYCWYYGDPDCKTSIPNKILIGYFLLHYTNRSLIYPFRTSGGHPMNLFIVLTAMVFTSTNGYLQGKHFFSKQVYSKEWMLEPQFLLGSVLFFFGFIVNIHSDTVLKNLRGPGEAGVYKIPRGGAFAFVSGANFVAEILEWAGYALACSALPAACFAMCTLFNIGPRAYAHHNWYLNKFKEEYPPQRKALIPFIF